MIRTFIVDHMPLVLASVVVLFIVIKLYLIISKGLTGKVIDIFLVSLVPLSKQAIKNTFQEKVKRYYILSNKINTVFYVVLSAALLLYLLMKAI